MLHVSRIFAHHWADVPNLGDITTINWNEIPPVDVLCGGFPCQDVSTVGKRSGLAPGTRSGLWSHMAEAIDALQPQLVVIENVRGLLSSPLSASLVGAPHPRLRLFIVAHRQDVVQNPTRDGLDSRRGVARPGTSEARVDRGSPIRSSTSHSTDRLARRTRATNQRLCGP